MHNLQKNIDKNNVTILHLITLLQLIKVNTTHGAMASYPCDLNIRWAGLRCTGVVDLSPVDRTMF